jgi:outer membrane protein assembly factor BamB
LLTPSGIDDEETPSMQRTIALTLLLFLTAPVVGQDLGEERLDHWHHWRGPNADGTAPRGDPPIEWSESKNVKWKVRIPGEGKSTPIVWKNKIFVLTAVKTDRQVKRRGSPPESGRQRRGRRRRPTAPPTHVYQFVVLCLDRGTGKEIWKRVANEEVPHEGRHPTASFASPSPMTDGKRLYVSFGSRGLYCYDLAGTLKWKRDLGDMRIRNRFGEGASPVVHGDSLIQIWDHEGDSFIACLDAKTGKDRWRVARDEVTTWNTPLVVKHDGVTQVVTNGKNRTRSYDLATGKLLWECGGQASNPIACPVARDGVVYCMTGHRGFAVYAIPLSARGDITGTDRVVWKRDDAGPYVASPLLYDDLLYFSKSRNCILSCVDAKTGRAHFAEKRLPGTRTLYASIVGAAGRVYVASREGTTVVLEHGKSLKVLATNKIDEGIDASPVIVGKALYLRGSQHLYCISEEQAF